MTQVVEATLWHTRLVEQGLKLLAAESDFWLFELPGGGHVEVFGQDKQHRRYCEAMAEVST